MASIQKSAVVLALLAAACDRPLCITTCGLRFEGRQNAETIPSGWTCEAIQAQEDRTAVAFMDVDSAAGDFKHSCSHWNGYQVWIDAADGIEFQHDGESVAGLSYCDQGYVLIADAPQPLGSAFSHELAHVVQNCYDADGGSDHAGWENFGVYQAIDKADHP